MLVCNCRRFQRVLLYKSLCGRFLLAIDCWHSLLRLISYGVRWVRVYETCVLYRFHSNCTTSTKEKNNADRTFLRELIVNYRNNSILCLTFMQFKSMILWCTPQYAQLLNFTLISASTILKLGDVCIIERLVVSKFSFAKLCWILETCVSIILEA